MCVYAHICEEQECNTTNTIYLHGLAILNFQNGRHRIKLKSLFFTIILSRYRWYHYLQWQNLSICCSVSKMRIWVVVYALKYEIELWSVSFGQSDDNSHKWLRMVAAELLCSVIPDMESSIDMITCWILSSWWWCLSGPNVKPIGRYICGLSDSVCPLYDAVLLCFRT